MIPGGHSRRRAWDWTAPDLLTLCTIPTYDGSGRTIHPSVVDTGSPGWHGLRWWMVDTPYPNMDETLENPSILASNDRAVWEVPAGLTNPIDPAPATGWNADCELVWDADAGRMIAYWRGPEDDLSYLQAATSTDGVKWVKQYPQPLSYDKLTPHQSPTLALDPDTGLWRKWTFGGGNFPGVDEWTAPAPLGPWTRVGAVTITGSNAATINKYHGDVIRYGGKWIMAFSDYGSTDWQLRVAVSDDGTTWRLSATNHAPGYSVYRPTLERSTVAGYVDVWFSVNGSQVYYTRLAESAWLDIP